MHFSAKCNSGRIAIQWFHIKHYLDYQYTKFQSYTFRVQKMCVFARYATLVPRLITGALPLILESVWANKKRPVFRVLNLNLPKFTGET